MADRRQFTLPAVNVAEEIEHALKDSGLSGNALQQLVDKLREIIEVREGVRGDPGERFVTVDDLNASADVSRLIAQGLIRNGVLPDVPLGPGDGFPDFPEPDPDDPTPPEAITGLTATATLTSVFLQWNQPHINVTSVEVWAAPVDDLGQAIYIGSTGAEVYVHALGATGVTRYYWVRGVSAAGVVGPYNATAGTAATTGKIGNSDLGQYIIEAQNLASGAVDHSKLAADAVKAANIFNGAITVEKLANGSVDASKIVNGSITAFHLAPDSVGSSALQSNSVLLNKLANGSVDAAKLLPGAVIQEKIAANAVGANQIAANAIIAGKIAAAAVGANELAANSVIAGKIATNAIAANNIQAGAITAGKIAANTIVAGDGVIANGAILNAMIANAAIDDAKIVNLSANKITFGTMSGERIAVDSLHGTKITAGSIEGNRLLVRTITADRIAANAITATEIAANTITGNRIAGNTITGANIQGGTITGDKIAANAITAGSAIIQDGAITNAKIGDAAVNTLKIAGNAVTVPYGFSTSSQITMTSAWTLLGSLLVDFGSGATQIGAMQILFLGNAGPLSGGTGDLEFHLLTFPGFSTTANPNTPGVQYRGFSANTIVGGLVIAVTGLLTETWYYTGQHSILVWGRVARGPNHWVGNRQLNAWGARR